MIKRVVAVILLSLAVVAVWIVAFASTPAARPTTGGGWNDGQCPPGRACQGKD